MAGFVYNHDVAGFHRRINRFIEEEIKATSASVATVTSFDQARLQSYIDALRSYQGWVVGQPQLDLSETYPREFGLEDNPEVPDIENEAIVDVVHLLELTRDELVNSQSARMASGLLSFDNLRLTANIDKLESLLQNYIAVVQPLDLPESSPQTDVTGPGAGGV